MSLMGFASRWQKRRSGPGCAPPVRETWAIPLAVLMLACAAQSGRAASTASTSQPTGVRGIEVYSHDFERVPGAEWSSKQTEKPLGYKNRKLAYKGKVLGRFGRGGTTLSLTDLPAHRFVRVRFDLLIIATWDGNKSGAGPDVWQLSVTDGPVLVNTTFGGPIQSFPDPYTDGSYPIHTGATESRSGFGRYGMDLAFPHTKDQLKLTFAALRLQPELWDESWALDNVSVEILPEAPNGRLDADKFNVLWAELGDEDPVRARAATWQLIAAGEAAVGFLQARILKPVGEDDRARARRLVTELDDNKFAVRERATEALILMGVKITPLLHQVLRNDPEPEPEFRIRRILQALADKPGEKLPTVAEADVPRYVRAIRALAVINTDTARSLLKQLAAGSSNAKIQQAARRELAPRSGPPHPTVIRVRLGQEEW